MGESVPLSFFDRDTSLVARDLLGSLLVRILPTGERITGIIVETEAYLPNDSASHAFRGKTRRNASMYLGPGTIYVYFTYGMHFCLNIVTGELGVPSAVLVRALEPREGIDTMLANRRLHRTIGSSISLRDLCRGPARLCQAMSIDRASDGCILGQDHSGISIEAGQHVSCGNITSTPRVGIRGDPTAIRAQLRWHIKRNAFVSHITKTTISPSVVQRSTEF